MADVTRGFLFGGGRDLKVYDNIIYNAIQAWTFDARAVPGNWASASPLPGGEIYRYTNQYPVTGSLWLRRYPELKHVLSTKTLGYPEGNEMYDNLAVYTDEAYVESSTAQEVIDYGKRIENNINIGDTSVFKDVENGNFEIKEDSEILKSMPGLADINMSDIGLYVDEYRTEIAPEKDTDFKKISPKNDYDDIDNLSCYFRWENQFGADRYHITIATDPELKNVVYDADTRYNYCTVEGLNAHKTKYYWDVKAYVNGRQLKNEYMSGEGVSSFTTTLYENVDKSTFNDLFASAKVLYNSITEGDATGEYMQGAKDEFGAAINEAAKTDALAHPFETDISNATAKLQNAINVLSGRRNIGYLGFEALAAARDGWKTAKGELSFADNSVTLSGASSAAGCMTVNPETYEALSFKLKFDYGGSWFGLLARESSPNHIIWDSAAVNDGYIVVVKQNQIELQRFVANSSDATITVVPNTFLESNVEYDMVFGAIDVPEGVRLILKCNGETIFDEIDTSSNAIHQKGCFGICNIGANGYVTVSAAEQLPQEALFAE
jgi:hypothetical protein